ncbi:Histidine kinase-, DNA gyrase B-, and HSP90-like ATPase [Paenibacillus sp. UNCCL117]|uniref:cache domain-containing sensor histidine kinase n=1 Tax=unclassified Paenibacillus TaxID=185978 RepID=UPI00088021FE|nr:MULTISPECIES: sensor histidine kinase [unclassified Paenibacillus]SDE11308.1 Histidine kinase-, DNA gyrase B-, and HSP90-like ATPase [Paenibacillus sp. cl123]SFW59963.1 Histidine kinase-, DNA gyrase B-, and HSP90-like ATPase [Paenibacillus sp. UNCCL117]
MIRRMTGTRFASSVSTKLFVLTFLSVIVLFVILALFGYQRLFGPIRQNNEKALQSSVVQVENYIKTLMNSIQTQLIFLSNPVLYNKMDAADYDSLVEDIMTFHQDEIHSIYLIEYDKVKFSYPYGYRFSILPERIEEIKSKASKSGFWWSPPYTLNARSVITVAKQIDSNRAVALDVNLNALTGSRIVQGGQQRIYLFTGQGDYLSTNTYLAYPEMYKDHLEMMEALRALTRQSGTAYNTVHTTYGDYTVLSSNQNRWDWFVFSVIEESHAFPLLNSLKRQMLMVLLLAVILAFIVSAWITNYIRRPVSAITRQFKAAARGELDVRIALKRSDEFTLIADGFNRMMGNLQSLFEDLRVAEEKKRHHELKVLQSQIHPHFLYNTLNAIYCLGETGQAGTMSQMIGSLMGLLQYSTDKVGDIVTVEEELRQLDNYVQIMSLRYGAVFELDVAVPEEDLSAMIPKLTLITLVENSIFYGLGASRTNHIIVSSRPEAGEGLVLEVSDTGTGIDPMKLAALMEGEAAPNPYKGLNNLGLRNVHERLRLTFGHPYGLQFENEPDEGLTVSIHLPRNRVQGQLA